MSFKGALVEIKSKWFWRSIFAELLGTTLFVFIITSVHVMFTENINKSMNNIESFATGFSAVGLTQIFSGISGAHINPAITCGFYVTGDISSLKSTFYSLAQYTGGVLGAGLLWLLTPVDYRGTLGTVSFNGHINIPQSFFMEAVLTFILTLVVLASHNQKSSDQRPIPTHPIFIGMAYLALHLVGAEFTGGSMNPARAFGPSLIQNVWDKNSWIYWVSPYVGATIAGLLHRFILSKEPEELLP